MKTAKINGKEVKFYLSAKHRNSYTEIEKDLKYLGEGEPLTNVRGEEITNKDLKHFWARA